MASTKGGAAAGVRTRELERMIYESLPKLKRQRLLALGCSNMQLLFAMKRRYPLLWITVLSESQAKLTKALALANRNRIVMRFIEGSTNELPLEDESFNIIVGCMPLVPSNPEKRAKMLSELYRVLRKSGHVVVTSASMKREFKFALEGSGFEQVKVQKAVRLYVYTAVKVEPEQLLSQPGT
jgi:ubiquinone/menaquinone biosynthesis C-methylase UbiE